MGYEMRGVALAAPADVPLHCGDFADKGVPAGAALALLRRGMSK
eukprot:gene25139-22285_t